MKKENDTKNILSRKEPEKKLILYLKKKGGRGAQGRITVRHKGGGAKRFYRMVDFGQEKLGLPAEILAFEYDPNRNCFISLLKYEDGEKRYQITAEGMKVGDKVICEEKAEIKTGNRMKLKNIPVGASVFNIELESGKGGKLVRGAGTAAKILAQEGNFTHFVLPSSEVRKISSECYATVGQISFPEYKFLKWGKAGRIRLLGIRPTVRGTAMNPVDHPHGGGSGGKTPTGMKHPKTPWGKPAFGVKTRKKKWTSKLILKRRKPKRRKK